jgi:hypothetical protein
MRILNIIKIIFFKKLLYLFDTNIKIFFFKSNIIYILFYILKYSIIFFKKNLFLNILFYNSLLIKNNSISIKNSINYFFLINDFLYSFSTVISNKIRSLDNLFFNLKWQERECREFLGINFEHKCDNRSLFLWNTFIGNPLKKDFPTMGFFELVNKYKIGLFFKKIIFC